MKKVYLVGIKEVKMLRTKERETNELLGYTDGSLQVFSSLKKAVAECRWIAGNRVVNEGWSAITEVPEKPNLGEWYPVAYTERYRLYLQVKLGLVD